MPTKSKKRSQKVVTPTRIVKESKSEPIKPKPARDAVDPHDLPTSYTTPSKVGICKSSSKINAESTTQPTGDSKNACTLEDDIKWCVAQLEMAVVSKSVTKKQKEENLKYIKLLQSSKTPVPRKRQIMRQNFGDYKKKMRERPILDNDVGLKIADSQLMVSSGKFHRKSTKSCVGSDKLRGNDGCLEHHCGSSPTLSDLCRELESTESTPFTFNFSIS